MCNTPSYVPQDETQGDGSQMRWWQTNALVKLDRNQAGQKRSGRNRQTGPNQCDRHGNKYSAFLVAWSDRRFAAMLFFKTALTRH